MKLTQAQLVAIANLQIDHEEVIGVWQDQQTMQVVLETNTGATIDVLQDGATFGGDE